jgi:hypothetical protein
MSSTGVLWCYEDCTGNRLQKFLDNEWLRGGPLLVDTDFSGGKDTEFVPRL